MEKGRMRVDKDEWVDVGAVGPDGHETFKMRVCRSCGEAVDACRCGEDDG